MNDKQKLVLLTAALRDLVQVAHPSAERQYAVEVLKGVEDLSPTGRRPSQPELQCLPRSYQLPAIKMTEERAKELLQEYRDTFSDISTPGEASLRNFPCVHVDLASGVDYSVEQRPIQADHASVDDKGNVTWSGIRREVFSSKGHPQNLPKWYVVQDKTPRRVSANPLLSAPYGNRYDKDTMTGPTFRATLEEVRQQAWGRLTPDDIYKDISGMLLRQQVDEEYNRRVVEGALLKEWVHLRGGRVSSYVPADQAGDAVFSTGLFAEGHMFVETMDKGEKAVTLARAYLLRLVNLELKS